MQGRKKPATLDEVILKRTKFQQHGAWWQSQHFGTICCRFCLPKIEFWENRIRSFDRHSFLENLVSFFCLFVIQIKVWINKMFWHLFFSSTEISSYLLSSVITLFFNLIPQQFWFSSVRSRCSNTSLISVMGILATILLVVHLKFLPTKSNFSIFFLSILQPNWRL